MFGLFTMLFTTLGATGMGSLMKMLGEAIAGIIDAKSAAAEAKEKRELARDLALTESNIELQKALFGEPSHETAIFTRITRRLIALIGMLNFFTISILCTIWPSVELITFTPPESKESFKLLWGLATIPTGNPVTTVITTGHISLVSIATLGAIIGFYFTPSAGGR